MIHREDEYYLVSQEEIYKIDSLIGILNFAISEILESRKVVRQNDGLTPHQEAFDRAVEPFCYPDDLRRQIEFNF